jgi:peptidyl-prolyl cis-trans isomerase C
MLKRIVIALSIALVLLVLNACSKEDLVGKVNGKDVTRAEFNRYLELKHVPKDDTKRAETMLKDYMQREAYAALIEKSKDFDTKLIETELHEFKKQILISRYFENFLNKKVNEEAIKNYYNTHAEEFQREKIKVAHVLIRTNNKMSEAEVQAALTKAQEAYSMAKSGKLFADVAKQYSEDKVSAKNGGELGWLAKGAIDPIFSAKIFEAKAGDILEPFKTPFGFHVVLVEEDAKVEKTPFEKVKGDIRYRLRQQAKQAEMDRLLSESKITYL